MYNNTRSKQIIERDYSIWSRQSWPSNRFQIPRNWLVWEWLLNWDATDSLWINNGTASNVSWVDSWVWYTKQAGSFNGSSSSISIWTIVDPDSYNSWFSISWAFKRLWSSTNCNIFTISDWWLSWWWIEFKILSSTQIQYRFWSWTPSSVYTINYSIWTWWNSFIMEHDINWNRLYINNNLISNNPYIALANNSTSMNIWAWFSWNYYWWLIQYIRLYTKLLSQQEKQTLYKEWLKLLH